MKKLLSVATLAAAALGAGAAHADVVVFDQGPSRGALDSAYTDQSNDQNFVDMVTLGSTTRVTGYDFYSYYDLSGETGADAFHLKIFANNAATGLPGAPLVSEDVGFASATPLASIPTTYLYEDSPGHWINVPYVATMQELHFDIPAFTMQAGTTYWIGISGNGFDAGMWTILDNFGDNAVAQIYADGNVPGVPTFLATGDGSEYGPIGDQMFRLTAVPEPGGFAMSALGLVALAGLARRRKPAAC